MPFYHLYAHASDLCLDMLAKLLVFDPSLRMTVEEALEHPYLATWHAYGGEVECDYVSLIVAAGQGRGNTAIESC